MKKKKKACSLVRTYCIFAYFYLFIYIFCYPLVTKIVHDCNFGTDYSRS